MPFSSRTAWFIVLFPAFLCSAAPDFLNASEHPAWSASGITTGHFHIVEIGCSISRTTMDSPQRPESGRAGINQGTATLPRLDEQFPCRTLAGPIHFSSPADTVFADEILIRSTRIYEPLRYQPVDVQRLDSLHVALYNMRDLSDLLASQSSLFVRDNGPGGQATISQRGLSPSQTEVLWEGFPINSLSLGLADLSQVPVGLFSSVEVSPGTPSSAFGGGSLGGTIYLSSLPERASSRAEFSQSAGAFDSYSSRFRVHYGGEKFSASLLGRYSRAENDFSYLNRATGNRERRLNNGGRSTHLAGQLGYRFSSVNVYTNLWYYDNSEEIPGSILSTGSAALQDTYGVRSLSGIETAVRGWNIHARTFLERDRFDYVDTQAAIDSRFSMGRWLSAVDFRRPALGRVIWQGGVSGGFEHVDTGNYSGSHDRTILGLRLNPEIRLENPAIRITPAVRIDRYSGFGLVVSPSAGANWEVIEGRLHLRGMVSRDFNPPSFNDLYWVPGGNPGLEPERSLKVEGGFVYLSGLDFIESFGLTGYRIWLDDGIYWYPDQEGVWSPVNVQETDAYGVEAGVETKWAAGPLDIRWNLNADWRRSEIASERFPGDQAVGQQMRYVPEWSVRSNLTARVSPVLFNLRYRWTDRRYITSDHTSHLEPYGIADLDIVAERRMLGGDWQVKVTLNNLLDEQYEIIQWYPMPGRYMEISIRFGFPL